MLPASAQAQQPDEAALLQAFGNYLNAQGIEYGSEEGLLLERCV